MTSKNIFRSMRDIDPQLILDAAPDMPQKKKVNRTWVKWTSLAACLALVIMCVPALIHIFNPSEVDDPAYETEHYFGSYAELCEVLPSDSIVANIPNSENATIKSYAVFMDVQIGDGVDFNDYRNFSYLNVDVSYTDGTGVNIYCTFKSEINTKEYVESKPLTYPPDSTSVTTVYGYDVYCADYWVENEGSNVQVYTAVLSINDTLYEFTSDTLEQGALIRYIEDMLKYHNGSCPD